ncbi:MAG: FAD-binding oxidoreductase [Deltaproteobacteria bacterium]|nr:FAD-binding oxidoreductase [Deltaproteobacteria bacterium]
MGRPRVLAGDEARKAVGMPPGAAGGPLAVAQPANAEHVEAVVRVGKARRAPIVARSRLPALVHDELRDALVVDCSTLQAPPVIDVGRKTATVGVGVPAGLLDRMARQARLCLRSLPAVDDGARIGGLVALAEPGDLGAGWGSLCHDLVGAEVVTGSGRLVQLGAADLLGAAPWLGQGLGNAVGHLLGSEGRFGVVCAVTLRLHPAPDCAWTGAQCAADRDRVLHLASLARRALAAHLVDTVLGHELMGRLRIDARVVAWDAADLPGAGARLLALGRDHGLPLAKPVAEDRRVRLGMQGGAWPQGANHEPCVDLQVAWPDFANVLDVSQALYAEAGHSPARRWSFGVDGARVRCALPVDADGVLRAEAHPLVARAGWLFDAGAVPVGAGSLLRSAVRDRMPTAAKVLGAALQRAWDAEGVLAGRTGVW